MRCLVRPPAARRVLQSFTRDQPSSISLERILPYLMIVAGLGATCEAQPYIAYRGIYNVASYAATGLPNGSIARGSAFAIFGSRLGPASTPPLTFPLQNTLGGVSITVTQGATKVNAIPIALTPGQINAIMPSNAPLGLVSLAVTYNGATSNPVPVQVVNSSFGIFTANSAGDGPGILQNFVSAASLPINSLQTPAQPGMTMILWGTGLGPVTFPDNVAPTAGNLPIQTEVFVGGIKASVQYNGRSGCCASIDQVVFQVPQNAPQGCWVPVYVRTAGTMVSNFVTMAISADGSPCAEPNNALAAALINGGNIGSYGAARIAVRHDAGVASPQDAITDIFGAYQAKENAGPFNFNPMFSLPPAGTCTSYSVIGDLYTDKSAAVPGMFPPTGGGLAAGLPSIQGSKGTKTAQAGPYAGITGLFLAGTLVGLPLTNTTFLDPGPFSVSVPGGADVTAASANFDMPQPLTWTNRDQISTISRSSGLNVTWSGGDPNASVFVVGAGIDMPSNSSSIFLCMAPPGASNFTVPGDVLANVPATRTRVTQSRGAVYVGQWNIANPVNVTAAGLDFGSLLPILASGKTVVYQ